MKKQNLILGLIVSIGISLIAALPRLIRLERFGLDCIVVSVMYNAVFSFSCWMAYQFLFNRTGLLQVRRFHWLLRSLTILGISSLTFVFDFLFSFFHYNMIQFPEITGNKRPYILLLRGLVISGLYYFIAYYLYVLAEKQKSTLELAQLRQAQLAAHLSSLKEQLSPHFMFNTLNTLSSLTQENTVKDYVAELANVYRYMLQYKTMDTATVRQELDFIGSYLYIIKARLEEAIEVNIRVGDHILNTRMPPLTLQLLVENAIKHNVASASRQLSIGIYNTGSYLVVRNNYQPKASVPFSAGTGLDNILQRYRLLFGKEILIEKTDLLFTVKLPIV